MRRTGKRSRRGLLIGAIAVVVAVLAAAGTALAVITPTPSTSAGATTIANSIAANAGTVTGASYDAVPPFGTPNGTSDSSLAAFPTNGSSFGILTTGDVSFADDPNGSSGSGTDDGGGAVRGTSDRDVTILQVDVTVPAGNNCLGIDFRFLSEEFPEFVGAGVSDSFVAELDTSDWTTTGGGNPPTAPNNFAFDENGDPISINSTGSTGMNAAQASGTTYDGATRALSASAQVTPGAHTLYLSIFDQGDNALDSAVFLDNLRFANVANPAQNCQGGAEPVEICDNGIDDDGDGLVDGEDPDCQQDDPPTYGEDVDAAPVGGTVQYKPPGSDDFQTLTAGVQVPVGTIFDTREGRVRLTSARGPGGGQTQTADFYSGLFQVLQPDEEPPVTELKLLGFKQSDCTASSDEVSILRRRRGLWGAGRGRFRTRGRHGSASIRGTTWFTQNRCDGTYFEVREGSVAVEDFTRDRTVIVRAGENYLAPAVTTVEAGDDFNCGVQYTGTAACWGDNKFGQATPPPGNFAEVSAGDAHACGLRTLGKLVCWGRNGRGEASPPRGAFTAVSAGGSHTCGIRANGVAACWGRDLGGQASPPGGSFAAVSAGAFHSCALRANDTLACWGNDAFGQASPPRGHFRTVSAGGFHSCGLRADRTVACWGRNANGQASPPKGAFIAVSAGGSHTCGIRANGVAACWGRNGSHQASPLGGTFSAVSAGSTHTCGVKSNGAGACWGSDSGG